MQKKTRICSNPKLCAQVRPSTQCAWNSAAQRPRRRTPTLPSAPFAPKQRLRPVVAVGGLGPHWGLPGRLPSDRVAGGCPRQGGRAGFIGSGEGTSCAPSSPRPSGGSSLNYRAGGRVGFRFRTKGSSQGGRGAVPRKRHLPVTFPRVGARPRGLGGGEALPTGRAPGCCVQLGRACLRVYFVSQRMGGAIIQC